MDGLKSRTSKLGWMIQDKPVTTLDENILERVNTYREDNFGNN